ncbi:MAG TPA: DNA polymerase III subunit gamma/tau, partial [Acetobacteraceae bacterium]|nr:DNA polymerase III subunit gamma/tau [Acetobacteraceae bacterium]
MAGLFDDEPPPADLPPQIGPGLFGDEPASEAVQAQAYGVQAYRVLARKYRPTTFNELIGQDALVRTLRNAFAMGRIAHAFMLTGVRGVGKTTTARILARALNCIGPDGKGGPTPDPCGVCENCVAILADRHPDVSEMDAASNTGVDDVREIIEATRFRPLIARTKVFIIDEVHMLSRNAFNALLKTLEEPPPHVKFVFATTEIRKVPITVLSRCQRFDLKRVPVDVLAAHFGRIAEKEAVAIEPGALEAIARAADGSVRDGLSLLDQAIALSAESGPITAGLVAEMLGLADRGFVFDLMEAVAGGKVAAALAVMDRAHERGADPVLLMQDLLGLAHTLSRLKSIPDLANSAALPELERTRGAVLAQTLSIPFLGRLWQMLLKGIGEVEQATDRQAAAEMILIRLCHVAEMPPPGELARRLASESGAPQANLPPPTGGGARAVANGPPAQAAAAPAPRAVPSLARFEDVVALAGERRDVLLYSQLRHCAHLIRFAPPAI